MAGSNGLPVRNVALFGHGGVGKTMLIERILNKAGVTTRLGSVEEGNTVTDFLDEEIQHKHTIALKPVYVDWHGTRVHLVDNPGYADFLGEVAACAPVVDGAVIVIDGHSGPQVGTDHAFKYTDTHHTPRAIFVNKLDMDNSDFEHVVSQIQEAYGARCVPLVIPIGAGQELSGVVNIVNGDSAALADKIEELKTALTEVVAESDDALVEKYLEAGELSPEDFEHGLREGIAAGKIIPIIAGSISKGLGAEELMDVVVNLFPSPLERQFKAMNGGGVLEPLDVKTDGPFVGQVFRSFVDPYVGHLTIFRVLTGTLKADGEFFNVTRNTKERTGKIFLLRGKEHVSVPEAGPGDLAAMTKLKHTHFGDTIADPGVELKAPPIELPRPMIKLAIEAKTRADDDKIGEALNRIAEEDPTFTHFRDPETNEHVIQGLGDLQLDILLEKMRNKYHVEADTHTPKVAYKETIKGKSDVQGKHKKQSGGHGQYGDVHVRFSPNERGAGYKFIDSIVGGVVPRQYIPHVDKGIQDALERGVIAGFPVVDVVAELHFGSYHDVDSSEMAFKIAASLAVQKGIREARPCILEPVMEIEVVVPTEHMGDINGDLSSRRGRILGMESAGPGKELIRAAVPESEILRYSTDLRSMTGGRGTYTAKFSHYDEVPDNIAKELIAKYEAERSGD